MSARSGDGTELRLYGEHINLNSRREEDNRRAFAGSKGRPQSALYASTLVSDIKRRTAYSTVATFPSFTVNDVYTVENNVDRN